ncbi:TetR/AcrR family transcriptional regulator [Tsukamurella soli]|uniref:TetR/AcrR family transcriptional regulator n=1 Tax=Tsukamurella soli TaxID=644556 RepID=A0ABP8JHT7_9ACTN
MPQGQSYGTQRQAAARKHIAILEAAHDLFAADPTVSLNVIAKRAGVGAGTLYRHFPTREDLILAVYRHDVERLVDSVDGVLASGSAREGFVTWFETLSSYIRVKHGLGEALHHAAIQDAINETYAPVLFAVGKLLDACIAEGSVGPGHDPGDVLLLMGFLWRVAPNEDGLVQGRRLIGMVFDGIAARTPSSAAEASPSSSFTPRDAARPSR